jgi:carbonic anhydrase/acetyltransferase-like protein (isoleucine patch superfamily)
MGDIRPFLDHIPQIAEDVYVDPRACLIGDLVIGARSSVWPGVVIRGDVNRIRIGSETNIQDNSVLHNSHDGEYLPGGTPLLIGNRVTVGHGVILHGCEVGELCLIGMGAIVLDRAVIEPEVILGAGSLVPGGKVLESGYLYTGSPARQSRPLTDREREFLAYSAAHYVRLAQAHKG